MRPGVEHDNAVILRVCADHIRIGDIQGAVRPRQTARSAEYLLIWDSRHHPRGSAPESKGVLPEFGPSGLSINEILCPNAEGR